MADENLLVELLHEQRARLDRYERRLQRVEEDQDVIARLEEKVDLMIDAFRRAQLALYGVAGTVGAAVILNFMVAP